MSKAITEFGDFQTPIELASRICRLLAANGHAPQSVIEPTCGIGSFIEASSKVWPKTILTGVEINLEYVAEATRQFSGRAVIHQGDFFTFDWNTLLDSQAQPTLVIGNLPWVTNAKVGLIGGSNLPEKNNFQGHKGFDAMTGKSNFDISEWMLIRMLEWLTTRKITFAVLCKSAVARKALIHAWKHSIHVHSSIYLIDAKKEFDVAVDACLLVVESSSKEILDCPVYPDLDSTRPKNTIGYRESHLVAEVTAYERCRRLIGKSPFKWRSGVKHDCSKVMEFTENNEGQIVNQLGEIVDIENTYLFPMLKSSCIANERTENPRKWMLVTQCTVSEPTDHIAKDAPKTWAYLMRHKALFEKRGSSIYKGRPPFSIFGVGEYSFAPWKIAISGFYHSLDFRLVSTFRSKPIMVDDTVYFIPCRSQEEADWFLRILNSQLAREFLSAFIFWDNKRPVTTEILQKLDLIVLARLLGEAIPTVELEIPQAVHV